MNELLEMIRENLRIKSNAFDSNEILPLIKSCQQDMINSGIIESKVNDYKDEMIRTTIALYVKGYFGLNNPDSAKFIDLYRNNLEKLSFISEYSDSSVNTEGE